MRRLAAVTSAAAFFATGCGGHDANPAIVRVQLEGATHAADVATGFVAQPGRVVTVAHVLEPDRRLVVVRSGKSQPGRVVRVDRQNDLALIAVPRAGSRSAQLKPGLGGGASVRVLVLRNGRQARVDARIRRPLRATVHGPNSGPYHRRALELDAQVNLGDSGAPVVDSHGRVAGVVFARASSGAATTYAVDASAVERLLVR